jgi:hypothetical protein
VRGQRRRAVEYLDRTRRNSPYLLV